MFVTWRSSRECVGAQQHRRHRRRRRSPRKCVLFANKYRYTAVVYTCASQTQTEGNHSMLSFHHQTNPPLSPPPQTTNLCGQWHARGVSRWKRHNRETVDSRCGAALKTSVCFSCAVLSRAFAALMINIGPISAVVLAAVVRVYDSKRMTSVLAMLTLPFGHSSESVLLQMLRSEHGLSSFF